MLSTTLLLLVLFSNETMAATMADPSNGGSMIMLTIDRGTRKGSAIHQHEELIAIVDSKNSLFLKLAGPMILKTPNHDQVSDILSIVNDPGFLKAFDRSYAAKDGEVIALTLLKDRRQLSIIIPLQDMPSTLLPYLRRLHSIYNEAFPGEYRDILAYKYD